jgi:hypothetical protein
MITRASEHVVGLLALTIATIALCWKIGALQERWVLLAIALIMAGLWRLITGRPLWVSLAVGLLRAEAVRLQVGASLREGLGYAFRHFIVHHQQQYEKTRRDALGTEE